MYIEWTIEVVIRVKEVIWGEKGGLGERVDYGEKCGLGEKGGLGKKGD